MNVSFRARGISDDLLYSDFLLLNGGGFDNDILGHCFFWFLLIRHLLLTLLVEFIHFTSVSQLVMVGHVGVVHHLTHWDCSPLGGNGLGQVFEANFSVLASLTTSSLGLDFAARGKLSQQPRPLILKEEVVCRSEMKESRRNG